MDRLYVVVPCYNEEAVLPETSQRLAEKMHAGGGGADRGEQPDIIRQ